MATRRIVERVLRDRSGREVTVCVEIDEGPALDREIARLANRLQGSTGRQRVASSAGGVLRVWFKNESQIQGGA